MADKRPRCGRKRKQCSACKYRYTLADSELTCCPLCGAERYCRNPVEWEGKACKYHGGASKRGKENGRYIDGRATSITSGLPPNLAAFYREAQDDPSLLSTRNEIALLVARWRELHERLTNHSHSGYWKALDKQREELEAVQLRLASTNDPDELAALKGLADNLLASLLKTIADARSYDCAWSDIESVALTIDQLKRNEVSKLKDAQAMVSAGRVLEICAAMVRLVEQHVADQSARTKIAAGLERIITIPTNS